MATEDDVRRIALSLPETTEKPWFGTPGFRVKDKGFLRIRSEAEGGLVVWVPDEGEKEALLASEPDKFFTTPHYDGHPVVLVHLDAVDEEELTELIVESWRQKAPKRVLQAYDAAHPPIDDEPED
ncbi:MAG TPA: MmcQ/YjbR family DNA-binding protein [Acidimicrobiales bacterium]